ncbi:MAG TPA: hypothetical protein VEK36_00705, partial [Candidatus Paceibacterota bacterium]|nr:hypothetical protein [Candidatus Paceibacterota bacterium]
MYSVAFLVVLVAAYFLLPRLFSWFNKRIRQSELQRLHLDNAWRIRHFNSQLKAIPGDFKKQAQQKLEELKRNTPSTVWQELENRFKQMDSDFASCTEQLEAGTKLHVSGFKSAEEVRVYLNTVGRILHRLQFFPYAIEKRLKEMRRSEEKSGELLGILSESIQRASELIKHEDVRYNTRKLLV